MIFETVDKNLCALVEGLLFFCSNEKVAGPGLFLLGDLGRWS